MKKYCKKKLRKFKKEIRERKAITHIQHLVAKAELGSRTAQNKLGDIYFEKGDYEIAVAWYRKAAEQGCADAQNRLGYCYQNGKGISHEDANGEFNIRTAVDWYREAALQGHAEAQKRLGDCYHDGQGVERNYLSQWSGTKNRQNRAMLPRSTSWGHASLPVKVLIRTMKWL